MPGRSASVVDLLAQVGATIPTEASVYGEETGGGDLRGGAAAHFRGSRTSAPGRGTRYPPFGMRTPLPAG
jgi:hypothetical protein